MSALHLVRMPLCMDALARWAGERGWGGGRRGAVFDEGRALHHLLAEAFGPEAVNCFRLLVAPGGSGGSLYLYSSEELGGAAGGCGTLGLAGASRRIAPGADGKPGDAACVAYRTGAGVRSPRPAGPAAAKGSGHAHRGSMGRGSEVDAFLVEALRRHPGSPDGMANEGRTREAVYLGLAGGAAFGRRGARQGRQPPGAFPARVRPAGAPRGGWP